MDLDTDLDALPAWGRLCVHEQTVRLMMTALGWEYEENAIRKIKDQAAEINRLRKENAGFRKAMEAMIGAAHDAALNIEQFLEPAT